MEFFSTTAAENAARAYRHLRVRPLTGALGAEVTGLDLRTLDDETFAELHAAALDHGVLCIRGQALGFPELEAFTERWGPFGDDPFVGGLPEHPHVVRVLKEADEKHPLVFGGAWHSDWSFQRTPPAWTLLYGHDVPAYGGDTLFANAALAWEWLSPTFRELLAPLVAQHSPQRAYGAAARHNELVEHMDIRYGEAAHLVGEHPLVRVHPDTGRPALFVNPGYTTGIRGMRAEEAELLLGHLFRVITNPAFQCRVRWEPGTLTLWDNRWVLHNPVADYHGVRRELFRTTVAGEVPRGLRDAPRPAAGAAAAG